MHSCDKWNRHLCANEVDDNNLGSGWMKMNDIRCERAHKRPAALHGANNASKIPGRERSVHVDMPQLAVAPFLDL